MASIPSLAVGLKASHSPLVHYPLRPCWEYLAFFAMWGVLSGLGLAAWMLGAPHSFATGWVGWLAVVLWLLSVFAAGMHCGNMPRGVLHWNGQAWSLLLEGVHGERAVARLTVVLDLQTRMWLRLEWGDRRTLWLWLAKSDALPRWGDLRRAVYSRANHQANQAAS